MELTKRDLKILAAIEKWGVMGLGQIDGVFFRTELPEPERIRLFFNDLRREDHWGGAYKRLSALAGAGLVRTWRPTNYWQVYLLTGRGHEQLKRHQLAVFNHPSRGLGEAYLRHEIAVCGVGLTLAELLGLKVETARRTWDDLYRRGRIKRGFTKLRLPDLRIADAAGVVHQVEVELTPKSRERYRAMFTEGARQTFDGKVLYLTGWPTGVEHIVHLATTVQRTNVYAADLAEFRAAPRQCRFIRRGSLGSVQAFTLPQVGAPVEVAA